jgi:membrane protease YdiL (CAAX protease family)
VTPEVARREIRIFVVLVAVFSAPFYVYAFARPWPKLMSAAFMWAPGLAALAATLIVHRRVRELGFSRLGKPRHYAVAYLVPLLFCVPVYAFTWATGIGPFNAARLQSVETSFHLPHGAAGIVALALLMLVSAPFGILNTLGEEIGWSGLLTDRLLTLTTFTRASLIRGAIWSVWHYPLLIALLPRYRPTLPIAYALACMTVAVTAISFVYTWLRLTSGSVWPAALLHATSAAFQEGFEGLTRDTVQSRYITYEFGAGFAIILIAVAWYFRSIAHRKNSIA